MLLYEPIGNFVDVNGELQQGISGSMFAYEMQYLQDRCKSIDVRINSVGGNVLDGYSIVSAILTCKVPVHTFIDGLAASTAGFIAVCGKSCSMMDYGTLMMHNASGGDDNAVLDLINTTICTILSNRCRLGVDDVKIMMQRETYLNCDEAINMGFVDNKITSTKNIKVKKGSLQNMALAYNQLLTKTDKMENVLNMLSVKNEKEAVAAIELKNSELANANTENETLKAKIKEFEDKEIELQNAAAEKLKADATALIENAIKEKKVKEEEKEEFITNAIANLPFVTNMLAKIKTVQNAVKVFDMTAVKTKKGNEDRSDWTIRDWEMKDSAGLLDIKNTNIDLYNEMKDAFYKPKK
jgi:ATP-dependent protease ClpP protease subunit